MILFVVSLPKFADKQLGLLKKFYPKTNPEVGSYIVKGRGARGILPGSNSHDMPQVLEGLKDITIDYYMMIQYDICHPPIISKLDKVNMKSFYKSILHSLLTVYVFGSEVSDYIYPKIFVFWGTNWTFLLQVPGRAAHMELEGGALGSEELGRPVQVTVWVMVDFQKKNVEKTHGNFKGKPWPLVFFGGTQMHS